MGGFKFGPGATASHVPPAVTADAGRLHLTLPITTACARDHANEANQISTSRAGFTRPPATRRPSNRNIRKHMTRAGAGARSPGMVTAEGTPAVVKGSVAVR